MKIRSIILRNFLIIQKADIDLDAGLTAVTGETGSGKSLFVEAVKLLLGGKSHKGMVGPWGKTGELSALVELGDADGLLRERLAALAIEPDEERFVTVRRVIGDKSLTYLNDSPVSAQSLTDLFADWMEISSQFENRELFKAEYQLSVLDGFALSDKLKAEYAAQWEKLQALRNEIETLKRQDDPARRDYLEFQIRELDEFRPKAGEEERLRQKMLLSENRKKLEALITKGDDGLQAAVEALHGADRAIADMAKITDLGDLPQRTASALIECRDLHRTLRSVAGRMDLDDADEELKGRWDKLSGLLMKHGVKDADGLIEKHIVMKRELADLIKTPDRVRELNREFFALKSEAEKTAQKMRKARLKTIAPLEKELTGYLLKFGMERIVFKIVVAQNEELSAAGLDTVRFMMNTIGSGELYPIKNLSGGELSRLLLALKLVDNDAGRFILFDEIDANIGGEIAARAAAELKENSKFNQILVVTHFPQTAAWADAHLVVEKSAEGEAMESTLHAVESDDRVRELARMMGDSSSKENIKAAHKLLER
ncbi:MAG TPA: AAA family ATPase [bacterium]|nr:AAA family ATPase [bacterium]